MDDRQKKVMAHMMEVAAGQLSQVDYNFGRVMAAIDALGETDNTLVIFVIGDNGGSGEGTLQGVFNDMNIVSQSTETLDYLEANMDDMGGWKSSNLYGVPWAWATNTPFQWTKQVASHFGGTRNGLIISWPEGIKAHGRNPVAVHPCDRHRADHPGSRASAGTGLGQRRGPDPDPGHQHGLQL